ncbi:hypothetical protein RhiirA1_391695 [Rhizophagus irregularis]|uniref:Uncharacterized protein n=2 Tax=Rhizophagus irregularis TaxID=588596 RepID=A0A2N0S350_9GLOM|nr:hypothetical protein RhiirA1_391695 [Rhizophagus irregularis]
MDLDGRAYSKLHGVSYGDINFEKYRNIVDALWPLSHMRDHETPEMWYSRIRGPFRKILEENSEILSKNGYITMHGNLIERSDRVHGLPSNYIYCSVCDSLVFISENGLGGLPITYRDNHLKRCISGNTISNEHARRKEILKSIDRREFQIWQYKQYILEEEAKINRLRLELFSKSTLHSEKDKLASISYDLDARSTGYETYTQVKTTIVENTMMPSAPNFEPAYIPPSGQEMVSPISRQSSNSKSNISEIFISSRYAKQNNLLPSIDHLNRNGVPALRLRDVIQRAYRNYKKRPESLAKRIWEAVRNDGTPDDKKYLGITSCIPYFDWEFEKKNQLYVRLANVTYDIVFKILYQRGYIIVRGSDWTNQLKWLQNPEYYRIDKDNIEYLIRVTEFEKYKADSWCIKSICERIGL